MIDENQPMESEMKMSKRSIWALAAAATLLAAGAGCSSQNSHQGKTDGDADMTRHDRLSIRMALAQNVYNGIAAESAVYPEDFNPGSARLNELGSHRVKTLIDATRGGCGQIVVLQGAASEELYTMRVGAIRQAISDQGASVKHVDVVKGRLVGGEVTSSGRTLLAYQKMLDSYKPKEESRGSSGAVMLQPVGQSSSYNPQ